MLTYICCEGQLRHRDHLLCATAAGGREIFLSFEDGAETLFGLLRLRIQEALAVIRELHVYGPEVPLSEQKEEAAQHKGLGKALLLEAERIAAEEFKAPQMKILSGIGAREYYRIEFGYRLEGDYMVKELAGSLSPTGRHQHSQGQAHSPDISPRPL